MDVITICKALKDKNKYNDDMESQYSTYGQWVRTLLICYIMIRTCSDIVTSVIMISTCSDIVTSVSACQDSGPGSIPNRGRSFLVHSEADPASLQFSERSRKEKWRCHGLEYVKVATLPTPMAVICNGIIFTTISLSLIQDIHFEAWQKLPETRFLHQPWESTVL